MMLLTLEECAASVTDTDKVEVGQSAKPSLSVSVPTDHDVAPALVVTESPLPGSTASSSSSTLSSPDESSTSPTNSEEDSSSRHYFAIESETCQGSCRHHTASIVPRVSPVSGLSSPPTPQFTEQSPSTE